MGNNLSRTRNLPPSTLNQMMMEEHPFAPTVRPRQAPGWQQGTHQIPIEAHHMELHDHHQDDGEEEFTCEICIETTSLANKIFRNGDKCAHPFCTNCVIKYIRIKLEDDNTGHIKCPAPDCDHTLDPLTCAPLIGRSLFLRWCDVLCEAAIVGWETLYCPHTDCNVLILNECRGDLRTSRCPRCRRLFCFRCKTVWHRRLTCEENRDGLSLTRLAEQKRWRRCPCCQHYVELAGGCSIVRCRCRVSFCYRCGKQVRGHSCTCERGNETLLLLCVVVGLIVPFGIYVLISCMRGELM